MQNDGAVEDRDRDRDRDLVLAKERVAARQSDRFVGNVRQMRCLEWMSK